MVEIHDDLFSCWLLNICKVYFFAVFSKCVSLINLQFLLITTVAFVDNMPRWRYPTGVDEEGEAVEVAVAVADSEVVEVMEVEEEAAVSVTEATRVAMHVERRVTLPGIAIRAEDLVMGLGAGTPGPDVDHLTEGMLWFGVVNVNRWN